ncbi:MAG: PAS domain-containing protein [Pseudomonadota bacterium]
MSDLFSPHTPDEGSQATPAPAFHQAMLRSIARSLGARYEGDGIVGNSDNSLPADDHPRLASLHQFQDRASRQFLCDARGEELLETLPLAVLVGADDGVAYMNRAARDLIGFTAATLEACGGIGALLSGKRGSGGAIALRCADGAERFANVVMSPVNWAGRRAVLFSLQPSAREGQTDTAQQRQRPAPKRAANGNDLLPSSDEAVALVAEGGVIEATNPAFDRLTQADRAPSIVARLDPSADSGLSKAINRAFATGRSQSAPVSADGRVMTASIAVLKSTNLACVRLVSAAEAAPSERNDMDARPAQAAADATTPLDYAAAKAQRLLREAGVLIKVEGDAAPKMEAELSEETERFFRASLLSIGARAEDGTVITVVRAAGSYRISAGVRARRAVEDVAHSPRLVLNALEAGLAVAADGQGGLSIAPIMGRPANTA